MKNRVYFSGELFEFLRELKGNNNREWFATNKARYEQVARDPMLRFIEDLQPVLNKVAPHVIADPKPVGGSLFRINRDIRFSKDKSPYKTAVAAHFRHESFGKDISAPGYYLHIEPGQAFMGGGLFHPDSKRLHQVRSTIAEYPDRWRRAISGKDFAQRCTFWGDKLLRPPRDFDAEHPLIEDLKRKDFVVIIAITQGELCSPRLMQQFEANCRLISPMAGFLSAAIGARW